MDQGPPLHPERLPVGRSVSGIIVAGGWRDTSAHDTKAPHVQPSHGRSSDVMLSMRGTLGKPQEGKVVAHVRPLFIPPPYQDSVSPGRLILRDGTTALIRLAQPDDREALRTFFEQLSPESRQRRFFSPSIPGGKWIDTLCNPSTRASSSLSSSAPPGHHASSPRAPTSPSREGPYGRGRPGGRRRLPRQRAWDPCC